MKKITKIEIINLTKLIIEATDLADSLSEDPDVKKADQRLFKGVFSRLNKEWWSLCEHYDWFGAHKEEDRERERHMIAEEIAATNRLSKKSDKN